MTRNLSDIIGILTTNSKNETRCDMPLLLVMLIKNVELAFLYRLHIKMSK